jgi:hypothetical protein
MHTDAARRHHAPAGTQARAHPRRRAGWRLGVMCLLIALMPLRSWAWAGMAGQAVASMLVATVTSDVQPSDGAMPPCHGASVTQTGAEAATSADANANADTTSTHGTHNGCALCDLCHAGMLPPPTLVWAGDLPQRGAPGWVPTPDTGRQGADGPFRPPRG